MIDMQSALSSFLQTKKKVYPCHVNRISGLDDPCERRLFYKRSAWDKSEPISDGLQGVFETGSVLEPVIERIISEVGQISRPQFRIVGTQSSTKDKLFDQYNISGTIDGFLQTKDGDKWSTVAVIDIKTSSPNVYPQLNSYDDLVRYPWTRKYRGQLMLYSLAHNIDKCAILFVNKGNLYDMKLIMFDLDMGYAEKLLQKAGRINQAIQLNVAPDKINDPDECPRCEFCSYCMPEYTAGEGVEMSDNADLLGAFEQLEELAETKKEIIKLERLRDSLLVKGHNTVCGKWLVTWTKSIQKRKATEAKEIEVWRKKIVSGNK